MNVMLIVGGETLRDAIGTEPFLPLMKALHEASMRYFRTTGNTPTCLYLTQNDMFLLAEDSECQQVFQYVEWHNRLPEGIPRFLRGLKVVRLEEQHGA